LAEDRSHRVGAPTELDESEPRSGITTLKWHPRRSGSRLGRYRLGARLGLGGAASVYLARLDGPHDFERVLAVKIIHEHLTEEPEFVSMFLDEAKLAVRLTHPNIVHVYELGQDGTTLYLAMEYLQGKTLRVALRTLSENGRRMPFDIIAWIGARAGEGLHHAHELTDDAGERLGLVHRDISPDNILLTYDGHVKLIDFGIAHARGRATTTELGKIKGKYCYMAPEQALGKDFDHRVDVFALGTSLYEAALGEPLFAGADEAETLAKLLSPPVADPRCCIPGFPQELTPVLLRALEFEPEARYPDAGCMARELDEFAAQSGGGQRERLAEIMQSLFAEQRAAESRAIAELRRLTSIAPPAAPPAASAARPGARRRAWRWLAVATPFVVGGAALLVAMLVGSESAEPVAAPERSAVPVPRPVTIDIRSQPAVEAVIKVDGKVIAGRPARLELQPSTRPLHIEVLAYGYEPAELDAVPDRDQFLVIPLIKSRAEPVASAAARAPASAPPRATGGQPGPQPPVGTDRARPSTNPKAESPEQKKPALVTDYPF
jgi:hypothetical protein